MEADEDANSTPLGAESEMQQVLGLFDVPAFARRGQELEQTLARIHEHCRRQRDSMLDMVRMRLRQWASVSDGPDAWRGVFTDTIEPLWALSTAEPPVWASRSSYRRRQMTVARDLIASVERFNRRWGGAVEKLNLERTNFLIAQYNRYYLFEKECILSSARLAARHFVPKPHLTLEELLRLYPLLPTPELAG
ncbi:hypothetical protein [Singulisphaera sp. PoT]|uniref:hypothetical protein n=1 Tax=Singulisphaera sp. PoT TaxID=3411797 RepID=UPI003BF49371